MSSSKKGQPVGLDAVQLIANKLLLLRQYNDAELQNVQDKVQRRDKLNTELAAHDRQLYAYKEAGEILLNLYFELTGKQFKFEDFEHKQEKPDENGANQ